MDFNALKIFIPAATAFAVGILCEPMFAHFLYKHRLWKKKGGKIALDGTVAKTFNALHTEKEVGTPRLGGVLVWGSVLASAAILALLAHFSSSQFLRGIAFVSRSQTWVPLAALIAGSLVGAIDDFFEIFGSKGLRLRTRLIFIASVATCCALWFYVKLGVTAITIPFVVGPVALGILFIPVFVLVALSVYAGGVIDGIDGLAGGVFAAIFMAYAGIAFFEHQLDLAALCAAISGGLLAFLWFNIPPARFYLSETGTMGLTIALTNVAFLTDVLGGGRGLSALPIVAILLVATVFSDVAQITSKKFLGHKLFRIAPLHHHFEAIGWPAYKVTMRYWIIGIVAAIIGMSYAIM